MSVAELQSCRTGDVARDYAASRLTPDSRARFEEHFFVCDSCWSELSDAIEIRAALERTERSAEEAKLLEQPEPSEESSRSNVAPEAKAKGSSGRIWLVAMLVSVGLIAGIFWIARPREQPRPEERPLVARETAPTFAVRVEIDGGQVVPTWPQVPGARGYDVELRDRDGVEILHQKTTETRIAVPRNRIEQEGLFYLRVAALDAADEVIVEAPLQGISIAPVTEP